MNKKDLKKITMGSLAAIVAIATPITTVISCGKDNKKLDDKVNSKKPGDEVNNKKPGDKPEAKKPEAKKPEAKKPETELIRLDTEINAYSKNHITDLGKYKTSLIALFKDKFDSNGNPINTDTIKKATDAKEAKAKAIVLANAGVFSDEGTLPTEITINVSAVVTTIDVQKYKTSLIALFKGKFDSNGNPINTDTIKKATDANDANAKAEALANAGVFSDKGTPPTPATIILPSMPTGLGSELSYKNLFRALFKDKFDKDGKEILTTKAWEKTDGAFSKEEVKKNAEKIIDAGVFSDKGTPPAEITINVSAVVTTIDTQKYITSLIALFKDKFDRKGNPINTDTIKKATDAKDAKAKAEALANAGVFSDKGTPPTKKAAIVIDKISFKEIKDFNKGLIALFKNLTNENGGSLDLSSIKNATTKAEAIEAAKAIEAYKVKPTSYSEQIETIYL